MKVPVPQSTEDIAQFGTMNALLRSLSFQWSMDDEED